VGETRAATAQTMAAIGALIGVAISRALPPSLGVVADVPTLLQTGA
jgi:hypothetical protein